MGEGKDKVLHMLQAGIITKEDAKRLLEALGESAELTAAEAPSETSQAGPDVPSLTLYPDGMGEMFEGDIPDFPDDPELSESPELPDLPTPPRASFVPSAPPAPPAPVIFEEDEAETGKIVTESLDGRYPEIAAELRSLRVKWISGSVQIFRGEDEELTIRETVSRPLSEGEKTVISFGDGRLNIKWGKGLKWRPFQRPLEKHLEIILPKSITLESMDIGSVSASVSLRGIDGGYLSANAVSGSVTAENLRGHHIGLSAVSGKVDGRGLDAQRLEMHTVSGRLTGDFSAEEAELSTTSGALEAQGNARKAMSLSSVSGSVRFGGTAGENFRVSTTSGSQHLALGAMPQTIACNSVSGKIDLRLPDTEKGFSAEYSTLSGSFGCEFPVTGKQEKRSGHALYGQGQTKIEFSTTSGSMRVGRLS